MIHQLKPLALAAAAAALPLHAAPQEPPSFRTDPAADPAHSPAIDGAQPERLARAQRNLTGLLAGTIAIGALTQEELLDVLAFDNALRRGASDPRTTSQRCAERERQRLRGEPSDLALRVIALKCREIGG